MITGIKIKNLRGIREGRLDGFTPLTVFVGPNGCGKSTVVDALSLAASTSPGQVLGYLVWRRVEMRCGARWLLFQRGDAGPAVVRLIRDDEAIESAIELRWSTELTERRAAAQLKREGEPPPFTQLDLHRDGTRVVSTVHASSNEFRIVSAAHNIINTEPSYQDQIWLIDARSGESHAPTELMYSRAAQSGDRELLDSILGDLIEGYGGLEILVNEDRTPLLHVRHAHGSIPVALAGEGHRALVTVCLELAAQRSGCAVLEEPELHQHPASLHQMARAIVSAQRRGLQIFVTTHSLELIDLLLHHLGGDAGQLSVFRLRLFEGSLRSFRTAGEDLRFERDQIGEDLR